MISVQAYRVLAIATTDDDAIDTLAAVLAKAAELASTGFGNVRLQDRKAPWDGLAKLAGM